MIVQVRLPPLEFERIVIDELNAPLADYGFRFEEPFHLYKNQVVPFTRERQGWQESVRLCRRLYDEEWIAVGAVNDEVDQPCHDDPQGLFYPSRHRVGVQLLFDKYFHTDLLTTGKLGWSENVEDEWWYFNDEAELRQRLREILPLILTVCLPHFDTRQEDAEAGLIERSLA